MAIIDTPALGTPATVTFDAPASGIVSGLDDLLRLAPAWDGIEQAFPSPMQLPDWTMACLDAWGDAGRATILVDFHGGELRGVAALASNKRGWLSRQSMIGADELFEPVDLVYADESALERLVAMMVRLNRPVSLARVPAESPTPAAL